MLKNEIESYVRIGGKGLKNIKVILYGGKGGGVKNCQNHPYVINEWPLIHLLDKRRTVSKSSLKRVFVRNVCSFSSPYGYNPK